MDFKSSFTASFFAVLLLELFEAMLEELIALGLSWTLTKVLSVVFAVAITQGGKTLIKRLIKIFTFKKGDDKMQALKTFLEKFLSCCKTNPKVICASAGNLGASGGLGLALIAILNHFGVALPEWAIYLISGVASAVVAILIELGVISAGWESASAKAIRLEAKAVAKEQAKIEAEAQAQIKAEEKAKAEKAKADAEEQAKIEAEAQAQLEAEEKAKAEQAHQARVQAKIVELKLKAQK